MMEVPDPSMTLHTTSAQNCSERATFLGSRTGIVLICSSYVASFVLIYKHVIVPIWGYEGFRSIAAPGHARIAWILATLPSFWMPIHLRRPSILAYWILYLLVIVPACLVPIYSLGGQTIGPLWMAASMVAMFALAGIIYRAPLLHLPRLCLQNYEFAIILALISIVCYVLLVLSFGVHFSYVSLRDIYLIRSSFQQTLEQAPLLLAYAIDWQAYVINPLLVAVGLTTRRTSWVLAGLAGQFAIYCISGFRIVLFSGLFLPYLLWATYHRGSFAARLSLSWTAIYVLGGALAFFGYSQFLAGLLAERMTGVPGLLTAYYYDFFSSHPKAMLGYSIFKSIVDYPYALEPRRIIGYVYFHDSGMSANANLWADAYANFGYPGMLCITFLLAAVLWLYDSISDGRDRRAAALVIALPAMALANASLLSSLLTNGFMLAMLLVYLMPGRQTSAQTLISHRNRPERERAQLSPSLTFHVPAGGRGEFKQMSD